MSVLVVGSFFVASAPFVEAKISYYGPTALCRDKTYSYSANHRGTCSHHGGVKAWYK